MKYYFTLGSTIDDVRKIHGPPHDIRTHLDGMFWNYKNGWPEGTDLWSPITAMFHYGPLYEEIGLGSLIEFSTATDRVVGWDNMDGFLRPLIIPGQAHMPDNPVTIQDSQKDELVRMRGTPTRIRHVFYGEAEYGREESGDFGYGEMWAYSNGDYVLFDYPSGDFLDWGDEAHYWYTWVRLRTSPNKWPPFSH